MSRSGKRGLTLRGTTKRRLSVLQSRGKGGRGKGRKHITKGPRS